MRSSIIPNNFPEASLDKVQRAAAIEHGPQPTIHPLSATICRHIAIRKNARQAWRYTLAMGAHGFQGDDIPIARHLRLQELLQLQNEVWCQLRAILQNQHQRLGNIPGCGHLHGPETRRGIAQRLLHPAHGLERCAGYLLRMGDVEVMRHPSSPSRLPVLARDLEVYAFNVLCRNPKLPKPRCRRSELVWVPRDVEQIHGDGCIKPCLSSLHLRPSSAHTSAEGGVLTQIWILQREHGRHLGIRREMLLRSSLLRLSPTQLPAAQVATYVLHPLPAPILAGPMRCISRAGCLLAGLHHLLRQVKA